MTSLEFEKPNVVSPEEWADALSKMLIKEKALTRARDALASGRHPD